MKTAKIILLIIFLCHSWVALAQEKPAALPDASIEKRLTNEHPSAYFVYANQLWDAGKKDEAVFWFYAGQLRYRFHLAANPTLDPSGDPATFAALQTTVGQPINLYAGAEPKKWVKQIAEVLKWDAKTSNGFTSKSDHKRELQDTRDGLKKLADYIEKNQKQLLADREQHGIGQTGLVDGVYVEEQHEKMPKEWAPLLANTSIEMIAGSYEASSDALLGPIFFFKDQYKVLRASSFDFSSTDSDSLLVIAKNGDQELMRRTIPVRIENGAVNFYEVRTSEQEGLDEGTGKETIQLRLNTANELIIQRDSVTEGRYTNRGPVRLSYTFWNRAKRIETQR